MSSYEQSNVNNFIEIDFDVSLKQQAYYRECVKLRTARYQKGLPCDITSTEFLVLIKSIYNKNKPSNLPLNKISKKKEPMIPHIIHQIWFGNKLPYVYKIWQKKLARLHPNWKIIKWTESKIKKEFPSGLHNQKIFNEAKKIQNYAKMADVARYEILYKFGGLYLDYDITCYKSFATLHNIYTFYTGLENFKTTCYCCNAIIGAKKKHPILEKCIKLIKKQEGFDTDLTDWITDPIDKREISHTIVTTGPKLFTLAILHACNQKELTDIVFPQEYFYPNTLTSASICYHYFHSSWHDRLQEYFESYKK
jgi:mannosyltransferase OCH1-like enzyme